MYVHDVNLQENALKMCFYDCDFENNSWKHIYIRLPYRIIKNLNVVVQTVLENNWLIKENNLTGRKRRGSVHTMSVWIMTFLVVLNPGVMQSLRNILYIAVY